MVELVLDGPAFEIPPVRVVEPPSGSVARARPVRASNTFLRRKKEYGPELAVDDDPKTRWATDSGTSEAWLEVDLGEAVSIGRVFIDEREWNRVRKFQLEYRVGEEWQTMLAGKRIGARYEKTFPPVTARHVRLHVLEATDGPTIWEFRLFPSAAQ
jgi:alpha-L-fucosidase